jgi:ATP-dependent Clp protease ATP-binding subunit ClpA
LFSGPFSFHWHVGETTTLLKAGSASGCMDASNILKPWLARGAIRVIDQWKNTA